MDFWAKADRCCHSPFMRKASTPSSPLLMFTCRKVPRNFQGSKDKNVSKKRLDQFKSIWTFQETVLSLSLIWENHRILAVYPVFFRITTSRTSHFPAVKTVRGFQIHLWSPINSPQISPVSTIFHEVLWHSGRFHPVNVSISSFGHLFAVTNVGSSPAAQDEFILDINTLVECQMMSFKQNPTLLNLLQPPIVWGDIQWGC